jgi:tetratricopeptide (TPR) repeat protein
MMQLELDISHRAVFLLHRKVESSPKAELGLLQFFGARGEGLNGPGRPRASAGLPNCPCKPAILVPCRRLWRGAVLTFAFEVPRKGFREGMWRTACSAVAAAALIGMLQPTAAQAHSAPQSSAATMAGLSLERARALIQRGDPRGALAWLTPPAENDPRASEVHTLRGICFAMLAQPIESTAEFDQAIALRPDEAPTYLSAGLAAARFNNLDRALEMLSTAARLDPALPGVRYNQALVLARAGRYAESEKQVDLELASKTGHAESAAELWRLKARDAYYQKKWQDTIDSYRKVLEFMPDSAEAYASIGEALYSLNRTQESEAALRKALALDPNNGNAHGILGKLYQDEGKPEAAIPEFEAAIRLIPDDQEAIYRLLRIYSARGDRANAARLQKQLRGMMAGEMKSSTDEASAVVLNNTGIALEQKGDLAGALADYEKAAQTDATNIVFARNAALLLCKMGRTQEAISRLRDILSLEPGDPESLQILAVANELVTGNRKNTQNLPAPQSSH